MVNKLFSLANLILGVIISAPIAVFALKKKHLTRGGVAVAFIVGTLIIAFGGKTWFALILTFLLSSSLITKYKANLKETFNEKFQKGGTRDGMQVLANGLIPAILALIEGFMGLDLLFFAYIGAVATVTADTWATEIGVLNKTPPRLITTFKKVEPGTSGGISKLGTIATLLAGAIIGITAVIFRYTALFVSGSQLNLFYIESFLITGILAGLVGSLTDSLLGATVQGIYYCEYCKKETEKKVHGCGHKTTKIRGYTWLDNDVVNLISALVGALFSVFLYEFFFSLFL